MSYTKMMKWHKSHPKGGKAQYMGFDTGITHNEPQLTIEQIKQLEIESFNFITEEAKTKEFPIYIAKTKGFFFITNERNLFGTKIDSMEDMEKYRDNYITQ